MVTVLLQKILSRAERHPLLAIALFMALVFGPFLDKAVHIDDPMYLWASEHILKHPGDFYGFVVNWTGNEVPMSVEMCNPPMLSYFLAGVMAIFGEREFALHGALLLVAFAAATGIFQLANLWCERPLLATFIAMSTPVFFVSATTLMCDVPMLALWVWAVVFWERALKNNRAGNYLVAMLFAGMAVLTKYSALPLLPLLPLLGWLRKRQLGFWLLWFAVPAAMIELYQFGTAQLYGKGLISAASDYAEKTRFGFIGGMPAKMAASLAYAGACLLSVLIFSLKLLFKRVMSFTFWTLLVMAFLCLHLTHFGHEFGWFMQAQVALYLTGGLWLLVLVSLKFWMKRDIVAWMLLAWFGSVYLFACVFNWTVSARSYLPLVPVGAILVVRFAAPLVAEAKTQFQVFWLLTISLGISLLVANADLQLANSGREAAKKIAEQFKSTDKGLWFQGHRGFQYYIQKLDAKPVDLNVSILREGNVLVVPSNGNNLIWPQDGDIEVTTVLSYPLSTWVSTVHGSTGAGFYGAGGLLPFVFGSVPDENYFVCRVRRTACFAPPELLNNMAWRMATDAAPLARDGSTAVDLARRACELTKFQKTIYVGTLGAAYAAAGRYDEAVATAEKACDLAAKNGETNLLLRNRELLERYRMHKQAGGG